MPTRSKGPLPEEATEQEVQPERASSVLNVPQASGRKKARPGKSRAEQTGPKKGRSQQPTSTASTSSQPIRPGEVCTPVGRLLPCPLRREVTYTTVDNVVECREVGTDTLIPMDDQQALEKAYLAHTVPDDPTSPPLIQRMDHAKLEMYVHLPMQVQGSAADVRSTLPSKREYEPEPFLRSVLPSAEFSQKFAKQKFSQQKFVILTPYLKKLEKTEYARDPTAYARTHFSDAAWLEHREYWIVDGATRISLCMKYVLQFHALPCMQCLSACRLSYDIYFAICLPSCPEDVARKLAGAANEVLTPHCDACTHVVLHCRT